MTSRYDAVRAIMNNGEPYRDYGDGLEELEAERVRGKELVHDYNATRPSETEERARILAELLAEVGETVWIEPPLRASYGSHTHVGSHVYANFNLVLIDDGDIFIGDRVMFGPNVTITTTGHPIHPDLRDGGTQFSAPVRIGDDVWIGSNVVLLPGITIGAGSIVAAGAVVSRHVPPMVVVGGVPARIIRPIGPEDATYAYKPPRSL